MPEIPSLVGSCMLDFRTVYKVWYYEFVILKALKSLILARSERLVACLTHASLTQDFLEWRNGE